MEADIGEDYKSAAGRRAVVGVRDPSHLGRRLPSRRYSMTRLFACSLKIIGNKFNGLWRREGFEPPLGWILTVDWTVPPCPIEPQPKLASASFRHLTTRSVGVPLRHLDCVVVSLRLLSD